MSSQGRTVCLLLLLSMMGLPALAAEPAEADWVRVTENAGFQPRDSCGEMVFQNKLWLLGGWFDSFKEAPRDVWNSADGKTWTKVVERAPWKHSDLAMTVTFKDRMWIMGGWCNGRLPDASASNQVWSSADGVRWEPATTNAAWSPRIASAVVVFKDRMWLLGGVQKYYFGTDADLKSDVWSSADGKTWSLATEKAPWAPRAYHAAAVLGDHLYVFGGGNYLPNFAEHNDVWRSADGVHWTQVLEHAPWKPRLWFSSVVYRDRIWVLGGWSKPHDNFGDVWHSADGQNWHELKTPHIWKARHEHSAYVKDDKIWVVTGHARPLANDVWTLQVK